MRFLIDANMAGSTVRPQFNLTDRADTTTAVQEESRQQNHFGSKTDSSASLIAMAYWLFRPHSSYVILTFASFVLIEVAPDKDKYLTRRSQGNKEFAFEPVFLRDR
jgi:hypothetical protein